MAINQSAANNENLRKFLAFIESDTKGAITMEQTNYTFAIQLFLNKNPFAMNYYSEFIKTATCHFPSIKNLLDTIDEANSKCKSFEQKSHYFCMDMWLYIYH